MLDALKLPDIKYPMTNDVPLVDVEATRGQQLSFDLGEHELTVVHPGFVLRQSAAREQQARSSEASVSRRTTATSGQSCAAHP